MDTVQQQEVEVRDPLPLASPSVASYIDLEGFPAAHAIPILESLAVYELMTIEFFNVSFEDFQRANQTLLHPFLWMKAVSNLLADFRSAGQLLERVHTFYLHRFLDRHGWPYRVTNGYSVQDVRKVSMHVCMNIIASRVSSRQ